MGRQLTRALLGGAILLALAAIGPAVAGVADGRGPGLVPVAAAQDQPGGAPPLTITRRAITVVEAEADSHTLAVFERVELRDGGDAPFVPSTDGGQGPMGLLRFALPPNAFDLTLDQQLDAYDVIQVDRGFASLMPVPPGATAVNFSYRIPYAGARYELNTNAVYPTDSLWVLVPADFATDSGDLALQTTADIGRQRFKVLTAENLGAGQRVGVTLGGLPFTPRPWVLDETVQRVGAAGLALLGVIVPCLYAGWRRRAPAALAPPAPGLLEPTDAT